MRIGWLSAGILLLCMIRVQAEWDSSEDDATVVPTPQPTPAPTSEDDVLVDVSDFEEDELGVQSSYGQSTFWRKYAALMTMFVDFQNEWSPIDANFAGCNATDGGCQVEAKTCDDVEGFLTMDQKTCEQAAKDLKVDKEYGTKCDWQYHSECNSTELGWVKEEMAHGCIFKVNEDIFRHVDVCFNDLYAYDADTTWNATTHETDIPDQKSCDFDSGAPDRKFAKKCLCIRCNRAYCNNRAPKPTFNYIHTWVAYQNTTNTTIDPWLMSGAEYEQVYDEDWALANPTSGDTRFPIFFQDVNGKRYRWWNKGSCHCDCWLNGMWFQWRCNSINTEVRCRSDTGENAQDFEHIYDSRVIARDIKCDYWQHMATHRHCWRFGPSNKRCSSETCCRDLEYTTCKKYSYLLVDTLKARDISKFNELEILTKQADKNAECDIFCHDMGEELADEDLVLIDRADDVLCYDNGPYGLAGELPDFGGAVWWNHTFHDDDPNDESNNPQKDVCSWQNCCQIKKRRGRCSDPHNCRFTGCASLSPQIDGNAAASSWILNKQVRYWDGTITCKEEECEPMECCFELSDVNNGGEVPCYIDHGNTSLSGFESGPKDGISYWTCPPGRALLDNAANKNCTLDPTDETWIAWQRCDDTCCTRVDFCEIEDLISIMHAKDTITTPEDNAQKLKLEEIQNDADELRRKIQICHNDIHYHETLVQLASKPMIVVLPDQNASMFSNLDYTYFIVAMIIGLFLGILAQYGLM